VSRFLTAPSAQSRLFGASNQIQVAEMNDNIIKNLTKIEKLSTQLIMQAQYQPDVYTRYKQCYSDTHRLHIFHYAGRI